MNVSTKAVSRLSLYRTALSRFQSYGTAKIYSCDLALALGLTAAQVRKDFSLFRFAGKKKIGYDVVQLLKNIDDMLQKNRVIPTVVCGRGINGLAQAIAKMLPTKGVSVIAAFDDVPHHQSTAPADPGSALPMQPLEKLIGFINENAIRFAVISGRAKDAQAIADMLVLAGINGILNLTGAEIRVPRKCRVITVSVAGEFEKLVYFVNTSLDSGKGK